MVKKCKVLKTVATTQTVVFDYDNHEAFISGAPYKIFDGYIYIEKKGDRFVSVDKPEPQVKKAVSKRSVEE